MFLAGWDAVLDTAIDGPICNVSGSWTSALLGWQRWQELNAQYTLATSKPAPSASSSRRAGAPPVAPLAVLLMGLSNQAVAAIAGAEDRSRPLRHRSSRAGLLEGPARRMRKLSIAPRSWSR